MTDPKLWGEPMPTEPSIWAQILAAKSPEAWISIITGAFYVWYRSGTLSRIGKAVEAGISGLISIALGPDIVAVTGYPPVVVHFVVAVFGFLVLDIFTSVFSDKTELVSMTKSFLRTWLKIDKDSEDRRS